MMTVKRIVLLWTLAVFGFVKSQAATTPLYQNLGTLTAIPQIDATAFANHGDFTVSTILPFETQNTRYFTNTGRMLGNPGFRFETITPDSTRTRSETFLNGLDGRITVESLARFLPAQTLTNFGLAFENSQLLISAINITNKGELLADARGRIRIKGENVDLSRSAVGILPLNGGQGFVTPTNFVPDIGVYDRHWGMDSGQNANPGVPAPTLQLAGLVNPVRGTTNFAINTPGHLVTNERSPFGFRASLSLTNGRTFILTNAVTESNWVVQVVMVQAVDTNIAIDVKFAPSTIATNPYTSPIVEFKKTETNVLAGGFFTNHIYMFDRVASETNFVILTNLSTLNTFMPGNYEVTRATPREFLGGARPNATNAAALIYNPTYTNDLATNLYTAYRYNVTNLAFVLPPVPGASLTNLPGRIEIDAKNVNLNRSRIRGEGIVRVTSESITGANMVIDSPNLAFDLKSADGNLLVVKSLAKDTIERVSGDIFSWSGMWTNQTGTTTTNSAPDPNDPTANVDTVVTNVIEVGFHLFVVDGSGIKTVQPVFTSDFTARSTNVVLSDTIRLSERILVEAANLTLTETGRLLFPPSIPDWNRSAFPGLKTLLNEGSIVLSGSANFGGSKGGAAYTSIVNKGVIEAFNHVFETEIFGNNGLITADGPLGAGTISVNAEEAVIGGTFHSAGEVTIAAPKLTMFGFTNETSQATTWIVGDSISDRIDVTNTFSTATRDEAFSRLEWTGSDFARTDGTNFVTEFVFSNSFIFEGRAVSTQVNTPIATNEVINGVSRFIVGVSSITNVLAPDPLVPANVVVTNIIAPLFAANTGIDVVDLLSADIVVTNIMNINGQNFTRTITIPGKDEFSYGDIVDMESFASRYNEPLESDPLFQYLTKHLSVSKEIAQKLAQFTVCSGRLPYEDLTGLQLLMIDGFNQILEFGYHLSLEEWDGDVADIPDSGVSLVIIARHVAEGTLHFKIFDSAGKKVLDKSETDFQEKSTEIEGLKENLGALWDKQKLIWDQGKLTIEQSEVIVNSVTSIADYDIGSADLERIRRFVEVEESPLSGVALDELNSILNELLDAVRLVGSRIEPLLLRGGSVHLSDETKFLRDQIVQLFRDPIVQFLRVEKKPLSSDALSRLDVLLDGLLRRLSEALPLLDRVLLVDYFPQGLSRDHLVAVDLEMPDVSAVNSIVTEGFHFLENPERGNLLHTRIESVAPRFLSVPHTVAGVDHETRFFLDDIIDMPAFVKNLRGDLEYGLSLLSVEDVSIIPNVGSSLVIVANLKSDTGLTDLHFRIFDSNGERVRDIREEELKVDRKGIELTELKQELELLKQSIRAIRAKSESILEEQEKQDIVDRVVSIVGYPPVELSKFLASQLSETTRTRLFDYSGCLDLQLQGMLAEDLSRIIEVQPIFNVKTNLFKGVELSEDTLSLLRSIRLGANPPSLDTVLRLNRRALQEAYPNELSSDPYSRNAALGTLVLRSDFEFDSQFAFIGLDSSPRALYVRHLELDLGAEFSDELQRLRTDSSQEQKSKVVGMIESSIQIAPSVVVYFTDSGDVPTDLLNHLFADQESPLGRLRWVPELTEPKGSVLFTARSGVSYRVRRALAKSLTIDSNGKGLVNGGSKEEFPYEFDHPEPQAITLNGISFDKELSFISFTWDASPNTRYVIEFSEDIDSQEWQPLSQYVNTSQTAETAKFRSEISTLSRQMFFRIRQTEGAGFSN